MIYNPSDPKDKERKFVTLTEKYKGMIINLLCKYPFVKGRFDIDDYYQEVLILTWKNFHKYEEREDATFGTWYLRNARWAIIQYSRKFSKQYDKTFELLDEFQQYYNIADESRSKDHVNSLLLAIKDLPQIDQEIIKLYLQGEDMSKRSVQMGKGEGYLTLRLGRIKKFIRENRTRWFTEIRLDEERFHPQIHAYRQGKNSSLSKPVLQFELDGRYIKKWDSMGEVERHLKIPRCNIRKVINGNLRQAGGFKWEFGEN